MRTHAYRPEFSGCLEDRSLLSGVAGVSADPVVLPRVWFQFVNQEMRVNFVEFTKNRDVPDLRGDLKDVAFLLPFAKADGLGASINVILKTMQQDLASDVPDAVRLARNEVLAATRAEVEARVQSGTVVVR